MGRGQRLRWCRPEPSSPWDPQATGYARATGWKVEVEIKVELTGEGRRQQDAKAVGGISRGASIRWAGPRWCIDDLGWYSASINI